MWNIVGIEAGLFVMFYLYLIIKHEIRKSDARKLIKIMYARAKNKYSCEYYKSYDSNNPN